MATYGRQQLTPTKQAPPKSRANPRTSPFVTINSGTRPSTPYALVLPRAFTIDGKPVRRRLSKAGPTFGQRPTHDLHFPIDHADIPATPSQRAIFHPKVTK